MSISKKRPLTINEANPNELNRIIQSLYDDLNEVINAVNKGNTSIEKDSFGGKSGDIQVAKLGDGDYELQSKSDEGWLATPMELKKEKQKSVSKNSEIITITKTTTLSEKDSGKVILMKADSDNAVVSLPKPKSGLEFLFVQTQSSAGSTFRITPVNANIIGYASKQEGSNADATTADGLVSVLDGSSGKYIQLTKATGHQGNFIRIFCTGSNWFVIGGVGTFVHEA